FLTLNLRTSMDSPRGLRVSGIQFLLLLSIPLCHGIRLGLIDGHESVTTLCKQAVADAKANGQCNNQDVEILSTSSCNNESIGTVDAIDLY
ncbi:hypothetical protein PMAYCL1PPCAC_00127, partial [Pristionchus mayeri]